MAIFIIDDIIEIFSKYLGSDEIDENTRIFDEYNFSEDDLMNISDLISENIGLIVSADEIEKCETVADISNLYEF